MEIYGVLIVFYLLLLELNNNNISYYICAQY